MADPLCGFSKEALAAYIVTTQEYLADPARAFLTLVRLQQTLDGSLPDAVGAPPGPKRVPTYTLGANPPLRVQHDGLVGETEAMRCYRIDEQDFWFHKGHIHHEDAENGQIMVTAWLVRHYDLLPFVVPG